MLRAEDFVGSPDGTETMLKIEYDFAGRALKII